MKKFVLFISVMLLLFSSVFAENNKSVVKSKKINLTEMKSYANDSVDLSSVVTVTADTVKVSDIGNLVNDSVYISNNVYIKAVTNVTLFKFEDGAISESFSPGVGISFSYISAKGKAAGKDSPISLNLFINGGAAYSDKISFFGSVATTLGFVKNKYQAGIAKVFGNKKVVPVISHKFTF